MSRTAWMACGLTILIGELGCKQQEPGPRSPARAARPRTRPMHRPLGSRVSVPLLLRLEGATVSWRKGTLDVTCQVTLVNRTGRGIRMLTNFGSVSDGFTVVVRMADRGLLARQGYTYHQSPFARDRPIIVAPGKTTATLVLPIELTTRPDLPLEIELVGGLRGSAYAHGVRSNVVLARHLTPPQP